MGNGTCPNAFDARTPQGVQDFSRHYQRATGLLLSMAFDYAAARCLLMNGHIFGGLELGARAIEKTLKAFLLFDNPCRDVKRLSHALPRLLDEVAALHPSLDLQRFGPQVCRFERHFQARYPDNPNRSKSLSTAELAQLDEIVIFLNENLPIPHNVRSTSGLYGIVRASQLFRQNGPQAWLTPQNQPLTPLLQRIAADYDAAMNLGISGSERPGVSRLRDREAAP
jgi:hypothetical protein